MKIVGALFWVFALLRCSISVAAPGDLITTISDPLAAPGGGFGSQVSTLGGHAVIGSPSDGNGGAVYVFDSNSGSQIRRLANPSPTGQVSNFGQSLSTFAGDIVVGASKAGAVGLNLGPGAAYRFSETTGALKTTYQSPVQVPPFGNEFGIAIAPVGSNLLIGEPGYDIGPLANGKQNAGAVYVTDALTGAQVRTITRSVPTAFENLGSSLAASSSVLLAGAPNNSVFAPNSGAAYLFDIASGSELKSFTSPNPRGSEQFGRTVAILGNAALVGAPNSGSTGPNYAGAVYMFDLTSGNLLHTFLDPSPGTSAYDFFGASIAVVGDQILIGAPADRHTDSPGRAFLFDGNDFSLLHTFVEPSPGTSLGFGSAVAGFDNGNYLISAPGLGDNNTIGTAYVFAAVPEPSTAAIAICGLIMLLLKPAHARFTASNRSLK